MYRILNICLTYCYLTMSLCVQMNHYFHYLEFSSITSLNYQLCIFYHVQVDFE